MLNTKAKREVVKQVTSWVVTYDDGLVFDGSIGVTLEELIENLPDMARARDHYNDLLKEITKMQNQGREAFCRNNVMAMMIAELSRVRNETGIDGDKLMKECWDACDRLWNARYGKRKKTK